LNFVSHIQRIFASPLYCIFKESQIVFLKLLKLFFTTFLSSHSGGKIVV